MQILMTGWRTFPIRKTAKIFDVGAPTLNLTHLISSHLSSAIFICRHRLDSIEWSGSEDRWTIALMGQRKVRTPTGSRLANGQARRRDGKCNREQTADRDEQSSRGKGETVR